MEKELKDFQKKFKKKFLTIIIVLIYFCVLLIGTSFDRLSSCFYSADKYDVQLIEETTIDNGQKYYNLYIDGKSRGPVDYDDYFSLNEDGETNFKDSYIAETVHDVSSNLCYIAIMVTVVWLLLDLSKGRTPFSKRTVIMIRVMAFIEGLLAVIPGFGEFVTRFVSFSYVDATISMVPIHTIGLAGVFLCVAEIINYGIKLQEDSDSIV
ncbi:MAG TPA: hypothetical protein PK567_04140 [Bacillota bacterium]|nr:hypothetical protein [Bacillota bacterium]